MAAAASLAGTSALADQEEAAAAAPPPGRKSWRGGTGAGATAAPPAPPASEAEAAAAAPPPPATHLEYLVAQRRPCVLQPYCFFVSWSGVLTLAFKGWPAQLVALKAALPSYYAGLPPEAPGSRWPKVTLACLRDGRRLTPEQLATLARVCFECSGVFQAPGSPRQQALLVDRLAVVVYECRSLERHISKRVMRMCGGRSSGNGSSGSGGSSDGGGSEGAAAAVDTSEPSPEERARVEAVVHEADDAAAYWEKASRDGNREAHYRGAALGATLVHECFSLNAAAERAAAAAAAAAGNGGSARHRDHHAAASSYGRQLPDILRRFRARVEVALPGAYAFLEEGSLHVTVRAIIP